MGLGQYNSPGEYCDPHTVSSVFLILVPTFELGVCDQFQHGRSTLLRGLGDLDERFEHPVQHPPVDEPGETTRLSAQLCARDKA